MRERTDGDHAGSSDSRSACAEGNPRMPDMAPSIIEGWWFSVPQVGHAPLPAPQQGHSPLISAARFLGRGQATPPFSSFENRQRAFHSRQCLLRRIDRLGQALHPGMARACSWDPL
jgi:hypothetical protein